MYAHRQEYCSAGSVASLNEVRPQEPQEDLRLKLSLAVHKGAIHASIYLSGEIPAGMPRLVGSHSYACCAVVAAKCRT